MFTCCQTADHYPAYPRSRLEQLYWKYILKLTFYFSSSSSYSKKRNNIFIKGQWGKIHYFFLCASNSGTNILLSTCCLCFSHNEFVAVLRTFQTHSLLGHLCWFCRYLQAQLESHLFWKSFLSIQSKIPHFSIAFFHIYPIYLLLSIYHYLFFSLPFYLSLCAPSPPTRI